jgi:hypothetical protein
MTNTRAIKVKSSVKAGGYCPVNYLCRSALKVRAGLTAGGLGMVNHNTRLLGL